MADLTDHNMERLSHLFASGNMGHAREIARLLNLERTARCTKADPLSRLLEDFLHGLARSQPADNQMNFSEVAITIFAPTRSVVITSIETVKTNRFMKNGEQDPFAGNPSRDRYHADKDCHSFATWRAANAAMHRICRR